MARIDSYLGKIAGDEITPKPPVTRLDKNLNKIAENGGGSSLPDYSEASDGDVLAIDNGAPAWKEPSGGGDMFVVKITDDGAGGVSADKTYAEIVAADAAGKVCFADSSGAGKTFLLIQDNFASASFQNVIVTGGVGVLSVVNVRIATDDTVTAETGVFMLTSAN